MAVNNGQDFAQYRPIVPDPNQTFYWGSPLDGRPKSERNRNELCVENMARAGANRSTPQCRDAEPQYHQKVNKDFGSILWKTAYWIYIRCKERNLAGFVILGSNTCLSHH